MGLPFGMLQLSPQTRIERKCQAPYYYKDETSGGYWLTHWLSGSARRTMEAATIMPGDRLPETRATLRLTIKQK